MSMFEVLEFRRVAIDCVTTGVGVVVVVVVERVETGSEGV